jgi:DNA processing protein
LHSHSSHTPDTTDELIYKVALGLTSGVGDATTRQLISYCGSASAVFKTPKGRLLKIPGIGPKTADALLNKENIAEAEKECELARKQHIQLLFYTDAAYPSRLKNIPDAPALLYYKGNADLNSDKVIAVVGTRKATPYGKTVTEQIIQELSAYPSVLVVSGLAYGIDIAAHKSALQYKVPTLGVMASGADIVYPSGHKNTAAQMEENGGLLTEYRIGTKPDAPYFPARNRIIAGISDAVIVVEAAITGGALITAEIANGYNRDVFAVPGNLDAPCSEGCNMLIRNHKANIFTGVKDLVYYLNWDQKAAPAKSKHTDQYEQLDEDSKKIVNLLLQNKEMLMDDLSWKAQIPVSKLASLLLTLELQGLLKALPGKKFTLS